MTSKQAIYAAALDAICDMPFNGATAAEAALEMQRLAGRALAQADRERGIHPPLLGIKTSGLWETTKNENEVTCHTRMIGGVLCRWWGDEPQPPGVAVLDQSADDQRDAERYRALRDSACHAGWRELVQIDCVGERFDEIADEIRATPKKPEGKPT